MRLKWTQVELILNSDRVLQRIESRGATDLVKLPSLMQCRAALGPSIAFRTIITVALRRDA